MKIRTLNCLLILLIFCITSLNCDFIKFTKKETGLNTKTLLITSDYGDIMQCSTYSQLMKITDIMISAHPDIISFDIAIPNLCYYKTLTGHYWSGNNIDKLYEKGYDPFEIIVKKFRKAGIKVLAGIRMNDHHGAMEMW